MKSSKSNQGFTLIELIVVIVILGILSAVAIPKFVNLADDARDASAAGIGGAIAAGSTLNMASCLFGKASCKKIALANPCTNATSLAAIESFTSGVKFPSATTVSANNELYTIKEASPAGNCATATVDDVQCTIESNTSTSTTKVKNFTLLCVR